MYIDGTDVSILYDLDASAVTLTSLTVGANFTSTIGLPEINETGNYPEYRDDYWKISATTVTIGRGEGNGSGRLKINFGANAAAIEVIATGAALEQGVPTAILLGTHAANTLEVHSGSVGMAAFVGETSNIATLRNANGEVQCGAGCTLTT